MLKEIISIILFFAIAVLLIQFISKLALFLLVIGVAYYIVRIIRGDTAFQHRRRRDRWSD